MIFSESDRQTRINTGSENLGWGMYSSSLARCPGPPAVITNHLAFDQTRNSGLVGPGLGGPRLLLEVSFLRPGAAAAAAEWVSIKTVRTGNLQKLYSEAALKTCQ